MSCFRIEHVLFQIWHQYVYWKFVIFSNRTCFLPDLTPICLYKICHLFLQNMFYTKSWQILHRQIGVKSRTKHVREENLANFTEKNWCQIWNKRCSIRKDHKFYIEKLVSNLEQNIFYRKRWEILHREIGVKSGTRDVRYEKMTNFT